MCRKLKPVILVNLLKKQQQKLYHLKKQIYALMDFIITLIFIII